MSILTSPRSTSLPQTPTQQVSPPGPDRSGPADGPLLDTLADVTELVRGANQTTAVATWTVTTMAVGLLFQIDRLQSARPATSALLLALLVPILGAAGRVVLLLTRAAAAGAAVGGVPRWSAGATAGTPPSVEQVWTRLHLATAALQYREMLARHAALWAAPAGLGFLAWSLAIVFATRGS